MWEGMTSKYIRYMTGSMRYTEVWEKVDEGLRSLKQLVLLRMQKKDETGTKLTS